MSESERDWKRVAGHWEIVIECDTGRESISDCPVLFRADALPATRNQASCRQVSLYLVLWRASSQRARQTIVSHCCFARQCEDSVSLLQDQLAKRLGPKYSEC